jgi:hypothetical protein
MGEWRMGEWENGRMGEWENGESGRVGERESGRIGGWGGMPPVACRLLPLPACSCCLLPAAYCLLPAARCLLPAPYCLLTGTLSVEVVPSPRAETILNSPPISAARLCMLTRPLPPRLCDLRSESPVAAIACIKPDAVVTHAEGERLSIRLKMYFGPRTSRSA